MAAVYDLCVQVNEDAVHEMTWLSGSYTGVLVGLPDLDAAKRVYEAMLSGESVAVQAGDSVFPVMVLHVTPDPPAMEVLL